MPAKDTIKRVMSEPRVQALFKQGKSRVQVGDLRFIVNPRGDVPTMETWHHRYVKHQGKRRLEWVKIGFDFIADSHPAVVAYREKLAARPPRVFNRKSAEPTADKVKAEPAAKAKPDKAKKDEPKQTRRAPRQTKRSTKATAEDVRTEAMMQTIEKLGADTVKQVASAMPMATVQIEGVGAVTFKELAALVK